MYAFWESHRVSHFTPEFLGAAGKRFFGRRKKNALSSQQTATSALKNIMKRRGFFSELRDKEDKDNLRRSERERMEGDGGAVKSVGAGDAVQGSSGRGSGAGGDRRRRTYRDLYSFNLEESGSPVEINLEGVSTTATSAKEKTAAFGGDSGGVQLDPDLEELIKPSTSTSRLQKFITTDKTVTDTASTSKTPISRITSKFQRSLGPSKGKKKTTPNNPPPPQGEDIEVSLLESSITVEPSPVKPINRKRRLRPSSSTSTRIPPSSPPPTPASQQIIDASQPLQNPSSDHISQVPSSQSSISSPIPQTPMSEWIHQDVTSTTLHLPPTHTESIIPINSPTFTDPLPPPSPPPSLLQSFLSIKTRYDSSVRLFAHDLRNGKYSTSNFLHLLIRHISLRQDKLLQALAYDLIANQDRWILFKPNAADAHEFMEGTQVKIYPPWREIHVTVTTSIIICTDFYKICGGKRDKPLEDDNLLKKIMERPVPVLEEVPVEGPIFMDLVPYRLKNTRTVAYQLENLPGPMISVEILVVQAWTKISPAVYLIKDSDDFFSFLEVPLEGNGVMEGLRGGKYFRLEGIGVGEKVRIGQKLPPFSVLHLFGGNKQTFYFPLRWMEGMSTFEEVDFLEIVEGDYGGYGGEMKSIDEIYEQRAYQDQRISLRCRVKEKGERAVLVTDDESGGSLRIEFVGEPGFKMRGCEAPVGRKILLRFLRIIFGKTIWDKFTICEEDNGREEEELEEV